MPGARFLPTLMFVLLIHFPVLAQRSGYGLEMTGVFGPDAYFTSGLGLWTTLRLPATDRALLVLASAEVGRKDFKNLLESYRTLFAWRAGLGYQITFRKSHDVFGAGPFMAYNSHHHRDRRDPDMELRWMRPYMQVGVVISWTRLVGSDGRFGFELRTTPAIMGLVGDSEIVRSDVPPPARWVFPVLAGVSMGLGSKHGRRAPSDPQVTTAPHWNRVHSI